jgi:hypothetical protein
LNDHVSAVYVHESVSGGSFPGMIIGQSPPSSGTKQPSNCASLRIWLHKEDILKVLVFTVLPLLGKNNKQGIILLCVTLLIKPTGTSQHRISGRFG